MHPGQRHTILKKKKENKKKINFKQYRKKAFEKKLNTIGRENLKQAHLRNFPEAQLFYKYNLNRLVSLSFMGANVGLSSVLWSSSSLCFDLLRVEKERLWRTWGRTFSLSSAGQERHECNSKRLLSVGCSITSLEIQTHPVSPLETHRNIQGGRTRAALSSPDRASIGWAEECRGLTGVPLSSKATPVPSGLPSQWIRTWLQSSASMRGRALAWTLTSMSSSKLHWLGFPLRPETSSALEESSFRNSEPSTRRTLETGL